MFLGRLAAGASAKSPFSTVAMVQWLLSRTFSLLGVAIVIHLIIMSSFAERGSRMSHYPRRHERSYEGHRSERDWNGPSAQTVPSGSGKNSGGVLPPPQSPQHLNLNLLGVPREKPEPIFATANSTVVTAQTGSTAALPCALKGSGSGVISWIRRKDFHLITVGLATYSGDERFLVAHTRHTQHWALQIRYVQFRDAGLYECQVSTHPPQSIFIELRVVEARAEIVGAPDKHVKSGSLLRLTCVLRESTEAPVYVFWYHNDRMINYDKSRGVTVISDRYSSALHIQEAQKSDSGNYTCVPSNAKPASINVHILNGEKPAAMQHGSRNAGAVIAPADPSSLLLIFAGLAAVVSASLRNSCAITRLSSR